jgi:GrpB-like predicted nucleotidyltransferase (UPF0157 family)
VAAVEIEEPSAAWPDEFQAIGRRLRAELGALARRIDHIGSTAVPGLAAKDVVDVQVSVAELDLARLGPGLERAGFAHRPGNLGDHRPPGADGPPEDWAKLFFAPRPGGRRANLHVRVEGRANQRYALLFRDYLRAHPAATAAYGELKRRLVALGLEVGVYADVKDPACDLIVQAAELWAARSGWRPGPSDA